jgi:glucose-1-phosphate cytidylyltransferase
MKAVILAGGHGTRLSEETGIRPKPMVEIGGKPILWHIMKAYSLHGITDFIICTGYLGHTITEYFQQYFLNESSVTFDLKNNSMQIHRSNVEPWTVTVAYTGYNTLTGGRLARIRQFLNEDEPFCMTYGDGLSDVNITELIEFHKQTGKLATLTAVRAPGRFGVLTFADGEHNGVSSFNEKTEGEASLINGGFFVLQPAALDYIKDGDSSTWEKEPLMNLAADGQLAAFRHYGFWQPMDTLRDKHVLEDLWKGGSAPWRKW